MHAQCAACALCLSHSAPTSTTHGKRRLTATELSSNLPQHTPLTLSNSCFSTAILNRLILVTNTLQSLKLDKI